MAASVHQCLENQSTLIYIYSGTVNTPYHPNTVWLVPCITETKQYALTHSCKRKKNICVKPSRNASTQSGPSIEQELKVKIQQEEKTIIATIKMARRKQQTKAYTWWYHINKG